MSVQRRLTLVSKSVPTTTEATPAAATLHIPQAQLTTPSVKKVGSSYLYAIIITLGLSVGLMMPLPLAETQISRTVD